MVKTTNQYGCIPSGKSSRQSWNHGFFMSQIHGFRNEIYRCSWCSGVRAKLFLAWNWWPQMNWSGQKKNVGFVKICQELCGFSMISGFVWFRYQVLPTEVDCSSNGAVQCAQWWTAKNMCRLIWPDLVGIGWTQRKFSASIEKFLLIPSGYLT